MSGDFESRFHPRRYRYGEHFMGSGPLYGRDKSYPWKAWRIRHVFSTCIHLRLERWTLRSANSEALNRYGMYPVLAYQLRPKLFRPWTPPERESAPVEWKEAA